MRISFLVSIFLYLYDRFGFNILIKFVCKSFLLKLNKLYLIFLYSFKTSYSNKAFNLNECSKLFEYNSKNKNKVYKTFSYIKDNYSFIGNRLVNFESVGEDKYKWTKNNINSANRKFVNKKLKRFFNKNHYLNNKTLMWNYDCIRKYRWKNSSNSSLTNIEYDRLLDVKIPWEISRLQFLTTILLFSKENHLRKDRKQNYLYVKYHVLDFILSNPPMFGINWKSPMEVSIRGSNIAVITDILFHEKFLNNEEANLLFNSINDHMMFVKNNLEWSYLSRSNHYLSNIIGLIVMSYFLPKDEENKKILSFAFNQLFNEIDYQFENDGGSIEGSTSYHVFSNEMILIGIYFYKKIGFFEDSNKDSLGSIFNKIDEILNNSKKISPSYEKSMLLKLSKINYFSSKCIRNNDVLLQIGDNDSGCFFPFNIYQILGEKKYLHRVLSLPNFKIPFYTFLKHNGKPYNSNKNFLIINNNLNDFIKLRENATNSRKKSFFIKFTRKIDTSNIQLDFFRKFGLVSFRNKDMSLFVVCKKHSNYFNSGHKHNDNLSIDLVVNKTAIITDPGSFCYTSNLNLRSAYRNSMSHFTPRTKSMELTESRNLTFYLENEFNADCEYLDNLNFLGSIKYKKTNIFRWIRIDENGLFIKDLAENEDLSDYKVFKNNKKVSSSYGVLSSESIINKEIFKF